MMGYSPPKWPLALGTAGATDHICVHGKFRCAVLFSRNVFNFGICYYRHHETNWGSLPSFSTFPQVRV